MLKRDTGLEIKELKRAMKARYIFGKILFWGFRQNKSKDHDDDYRANLFIM